MSKKFLNCLERRAYVETKKIILDKVLEDIKRMQELEKILVQDIVENCDHHHKNGKSAFKSGPFCKICEICSYNDM